MRLATYNVEWFNELFDRHDRLRLDGAWSGRYNVTRRQQGEALATVFRALDADGVMVIEAPDHNGKRSTLRALEAFAARFDLRTRAAVIGFSNDTQQEIAFLYDPEVLRVRHDPQAAPDAPRFDQVLALDVDVDARGDPIRWSKPPLELAVETASGQHLRLIGVHAKSKAPHGATGPADATRIAIENRRKQLAQCIWLRRRIAAHLVAGDSLVVMGDFNDGPGLDTYEKLFGRSGVEIVLGTDGPPEARLFDPHADAALARRLPSIAATARFWDRARKRWFGALLDYIMVSPDLVARGGAWRIWHPFDDPECWADTALQAALLDASDHFPVTWDLP